MATRYISVFDKRTVFNPGTLVRLSHADDSTPEWKNELGRVFMVGFYSRQDGLDCVWLVTPQGEYQQTADRDSLLKYFTVVRPSAITDFYGRTVEKLPRWPKRSA